MDKFLAETVFGRLQESPIKAKLNDDEFTFKVDRKDGTFLGSVVKIGGTIYENSMAGDGLGGPIRKRAEKHGFRFVTAENSGLFK